jgi:hypothetical protein
MRRTDRTPYVTLYAVQYERRTRHRAVYPPLLCVELELELIQTPI